jgi:hypothetical protein
MIDHRCWLAHEHPPTWVDGQVRCTWCGNTPIAPIPTLSDILWFTVGTVGSIAVCWLRAVSRR